jgi:hypothetical protein
MSSQNQRVVVRILIFPSNRAVFQGRTELWSGLRFADFAEKLDSGWNRTSAALALYLMHSYHSTTMCHFIKVKTFALGVWKTLPAQHQSTLLTILNMFPACEHQFISIYLSNLCSSPPRSLREDPHTHEWRDTLNT